MTNSGGTGRPAADQDARDQSAPPPDSGDPGSAHRANGKPSASPQEGNGAPANYEGQRRAPDPAVNTRRPQPASDGGQPRGAAAARAATKITRAREDRTPRGQQDATPNLWPATANPQQEAPKDEPLMPPAPVPPPSLVAKQRREAAAQASATSAAAASPPAPTVAGPSSPSSMSAPTAVPTAPPTPLLPPVDTQASMDAVPALEPPPRPKPSLTPRSTNPRRSGRVRKARLRLLRVDPWSVMKTAFLLSVALGVTLFVAVAVLWSVLDAAGVFESLDEVITDMTASDNNPGTDIDQYVELSRVLGFTTLIAVVDVVLLTALATLGAFLYNLSASLLGGLEVTLAEDD